MKTEVMISVPIEVRLILERAADLYRKGVNPGLLETLTVHIQELAKLTAEPPKPDVTLDLELSPEAMDRIRAECARRGLPDDEDSYGVIITDLILKHKRGEIDI